MGRKRETGSTVTETGSQRPWSATYEAWKRDAVGGARSALAATRLREPIAGVPKATPLTRRRLLWRQPPVYEGAVVLARDLQRQNLAEQAQKGDRIVYGQSAFRGKLDSIFASP